MEKSARADIRPIERGGEQEIEIEQGKRRNQEIGLVGAPELHRFDPLGFSRKTRVKTIPNRITIVRAPKYFGIGVVFVRVATAKTIAHCETTAVRRATPTPCCPGAVHAFGRSCLHVAAIPVNLVLTFGAGNTVPGNGAEWRTMKESSVALLLSLLSLVGCASHGELLFNNAIVVGHLEGNYQTLARCTYEHLARQQAQLSMRDLREQETVKIAFTKAPQT